MSSTAPIVVDLAQARALRDRHPMLRDAAIPPARTRASVRSLPLRPEAHGAPYDPRFAADVLSGLAQVAKSIPSTWLYDRRGSELFEDITQLHEYYPTRSEIAILRHCVNAIAEQAGSDAVVVEIGSGSSRKTPLLLAALDSPHAYVPIDISAEFLIESVTELRHRFPGLRMLPLIADFTKPLSLPAELGSAPAGARRLVFFPGSTIGNLSPQQAMQCLSRLAELAGDDGLVLIGADSNRDEQTLLPAYDDAAGVTAEFNLNLLRRINRELRGNFDLSRFRHLARFDRQHARMEMHLVSTTAQQVEVLGRRFQFRAGESIHTENSYKYDAAALGALARAAGLHRRTAWTDETRRFVVHLFDRRGSASAMDSERTTPA
ncbi:MAG: L-histidine N(alpha)-methyltransferase [Burkholderiaceae bacterium]